MGWRDFFGSLFDSQPTNGQSEMTVEEKEYKAQCDTPIEYRNCMNCKHLGGYDGEFYCKMDYSVNFADRKQIAENNCLYANWSPRKYDGDWLIFDPNQWFEGC